MDDCVLKNEFAIVEIKRDYAANGVRLMIRDLISGNAVYLDPLELEALTRIKCHHFLPLFNPGELQ